MAETLEVTDDTFEAEILQSDKPAVVDFWAEWCAPCRAISPIMQQLSEEYGDRLKITKMNIDDSPRTPGDYGVRAIPTVLAFHNGQVVEQLVGARPKASFDEMVKKLLGL
jgi:thioredoxin 1